MAGNGKKTIALKTIWMLLQTNKRPRRWLTSPDKQLEPKMTMELSLKDLMEEIFQIKETVNKVDGAFTEVKIEIAQMKARQNEIKEKVNQQLRVCEDELLTLKETSNQIKFLEWSLKYQENKRRKIKFETGYLETAWGTSPRGRLWKYCTGADKNERWERPLRWKGCTWASSRVRSRRQPLVSETLGSPRV